LEANVSPLSYFLSLLIPEEIIEPVFDKKDYLFELVDDSLSSVTDEEELALASFIVIILLLFLYLEIGVAEGSTNGSSSNPCIFFLALNSLDINLF
jgi:hypothetical protein